MAAATVGPVAGPEPFRVGTLLQQQFASGIEQECRERAMQHPGAVVAGRFGKMTLFPVVLIDKNQFFGFRRNYPVYTFHFASLSLFRVIVG